MLKANFHEVNPIADRSAVLVVFAVLAMLLGGCAQVQFAAHAAKSVAPGTTSPEGGYKVGDPYQVFGVWYYPAEDPDYEEVGVASWYGREFHGRRTANGTIFDMNGLSAAHRTLPMPSLVRVTNLANGRSLVLTVNDRGPFARGRIIDVSRRAAQLLGFFAVGTAKVRVQAVRAEPGEPLIIEAKEDPARHDTTIAAAEVPPAAPAKATAVEPAPAPAVVAAVATVPAGISGDSGSAIYVQAGAFANADNAQRLAAELARFGTAQTMKANINDRLIYRVRLGPLATAEDADSLRSRMIAAGYQDARLVFD